MSEPGYKETISSLTPEEYEELRTLLGIKPLDAAEQERIAGLKWWQKAQEGILPPKDTTELTDPVV